ncbi:predicted protein [Methanosarcina acetivorans C2A]|uniref:Uncharacterized protein n=1 Tax=Methanosarcina acetivorans (strain ATCC 35395 / DSM 2834 / JCM 12185 / C2A) TaxID=188937 RepID=Q8TSQ4_METAC|nr:predicted protein [Methanosarcina acetivorans C2A]
MDLGQVHCQLIRIPITAKAKSRSAGYIYRSLLEILSPRMSGKPVCLASFMAMNPKKAARIIAAPAPVQFCTIGWFTSKSIMSLFQAPSIKPGPRKSFPR